MEPSYGPFWLTTNSSLFQLNLVNGWVSSQHKWMTYDFHPHGWWWMNFIHCGWKVNVYGWSSYVIMLAMMHVASMTQT
jgi:hypothetical protein